MGKYNIGGFIVEMNPRYERTIKQALPYKVDDNLEAIFNCDISDKLLEETKELYKTLSYEDTEYMDLGVAFYCQILKHDGIMLHSSAVVRDGYAYLFSANSGTGKSTHTSLWLKNFPNTYILNDDKPLLVVKEDGVYACGTPFSGKHDISKNEIVPLKGICFIERSKDNWIKEMSSKDAIRYFFEQTLRVPVELDMDLILNLMGKIIQKVGIYKMGCNMEDEAAYKSFNYMNK